MHGNYIYKSCIGKSCANQLPIENTIAYNVTLNLNSTFNEQLIVNRHLFGQINKMNFS